VLADRRRGKDSRRTGGFGGDVVMKPKKRMGDGREGEKGGRHRSEDVLES
jgi:hypothetical protein